VGIWCHDLESSARGVRHVAVPKCQGLSTQQRANDREGDRYVGLLDEVVDMFLDNARKRGCPVSMSGAGQPKAGTGAAPVQ
jgi:hypothetical protein